MRIGICAYWFNRGQGVVARQLRSALETLGHESFVLARPTRASNIRPSFVDHTGVWDQPGITEASNYRIPSQELLAWSRENELDVVLFDQNYEFEAIEELRRSGTRTVGRFVWEQFGREDVDPAKRAFNVVYSLTGCERERYETLGIDSPRVRWGIHPELLAYARDRDEPGPPADESVVFFYPAGFLTRRKPVKVLLRAFGRVQDSSARLVVKGQVERKVELLERAERRDPRVEVVLEDLPTDEHLGRFAAADVCVAPSRWEGLGLHLYEAMALGLPVITNDNPPMNEVIRERDNGLLVRARRRGRAPSGIPAYTPSVRDLARAMREALEPGLRQHLAKGVIEARERLSWGHTIADYGELISSVR